jgi:hypothetical protein
MVQIMALKSGIAANCGTLLRVHKRLAAKTKVRRTMDNAIIVSISLRVCTQAVGWFTSGLLLLHPRYCSMKCNAIVYVG